MRGRRGCANIGGMRDSFSAALLLLLAGSGASACTALLGGFDFEGKAETTTGSGGGGAGTGGSTGSSSTGGGGGGPTASCTTLGQPFDILGEADFGKDEIDDKPLLIADLGAAELVHVIVNDQTAQQMVIRTVRNDPASPLVGPIVKVDRFSYAGGWAEPAPGTLHVQGSHFDVGNGSTALGEMNFEVGDFQGIMSQGTFVGYPTPAACNGPDNNRPSRMVVSAAKPVARFLATCVSDDLANPGKLKASLWGAASTDASATQIAAGLPDEPLMNPQYYAFEAGQHFVALGGDKVPTAAFAFGPNLGDLSKTHAFQIDPPNLSIYTGLVPLLGDTGIALFVASVDPGFTSARLYGGALTPQQYGALGTAPQTVLPTLVQGTEVTKMAPVSRPVVDDKGIIAASSTLGQDSVRVSWLRRDATPLVLGQEVYSTTTTSIISAVAAPAGATKLVVWIEKGGNGVTTVKGRRLLCTGE